MHYRPADREPPAGVAVVGGWIFDGKETKEPSGVIRGFDAVTGARLWSWDAGALDNVTISTADLNGDIHASAEYRAHLAGVEGARAGD